MLATRKFFAWCLFAFFLFVNTVSYADAQAAPSTNSGIMSDSGIVKRAQPKAGSFSIQVGAFKQRAAVEKELARLAKKGCDPFYRYEDTGGKGMWFRVYVGSYATKQDAREAAGQLMQRSVVRSHMIRKVDQNGKYIFSADYREPDSPQADLDTEAKKPAVQSPRLRQEPQEVEMRPAEAPLNRSGETTRTAAGADSLVYGSTVTGATPVRLSLLDAIRYSLEGNREIHVVSFTPKQAREDITNAESVYDPLLFAKGTFRRDPNLESSVTDIVTEDDGVTQTGIRKPLETGGTLSTYLETRYGDLNNAEFDRTYKHIVAPTVELRQPLLNNIGSQKEQTAIKIANYQANISDEAFRQKVLDVANSTAKVYWKLYLFKELIAINRQNLDMAEEVSRREAERLARGISLQLDVERARSNAQTRRSTLLRSQQEYQVAMDRLKLLLNWGQFNIDSENEIVPVEAPQTAPVYVDESEAIETALKNRPEIMKAQQELKIGQVDEELSEHQQLPKLDAIGRYSVSGYGEDFNDAGTDMGFNDEDAWEVGITFEYPIGNRAAKSRYRKKTLRRQQIKVQLERLEDDIKLDVKQVLHGIRTARGEIDATRRAKAAAEKVVEGEFARFDIGQTNNIELLRAQDLLAVTSRSFVRAIAEYNITIHELARAQGVLPEGVTIAEAQRRAY